MFCKDYIDDPNTQLCKCSYMKKVQNQINEKYRGTTVKPIILYITLWSDDSEVNLLRMSIVFLVINKILIIVASVRESSSSSIYNNKNNHDINIYIK